MRWVRGIVVLIVIAGLVARIAGYETGTALLAAVTLAEVGLAIFALRAVWAGVKTLRTTGGDPWALVETSLGQFLPPAAVAFVTSEMRIFLAFFRAVTVRPILDGSPDSTERKVTTRHTSQYKTLLFVLLLLVAIETAVVHMVLAKVLGTGGWKTVLESVLIGFSAYGAIWLIGDARLMRESTHKLADDGLALALGVRWKGIVPYGAIDRVERAPSDLEDRDDAADITPIALDTPNVVLHLRAPVTLHGIFNMPRTVDEVRLFVDEPDVLVGALREAIPSHDEVQSP